MTPKDYILDELLLSLETHNLDKERLEYITQHPAGAEFLQALLLKIEMLEDALHETLQISDCRQRKLDDYEKLFNETEQACRQMKRTLEDCAGALGLFAP